MINEFISFSGRLNRLKAFEYNVIIGIPLSFFKIIVKYDIHEAMHTVTLVLLLIMSIILIISLISICVRRFHDIGLTGWLILVNLIPVVNGIVGLILLFKKGTDGPNKYGEDPLNTSHEI